MYPVLHLVRNKEGRVIDIKPSEEGESRESLVHCELTQIADSENRNSLKHQVEKRLQDVIKVTEDFADMLGKLDKTVEDLKLRAKNSPEHRDELLETGEFFSWLKDGAFVFLGACTYKRTSGKKMEMDQGSTCLLYTSPSPRD